jgi:hypothetical protein
MQLDIKIKASIEKPVDWSKTTDTQGKIKLLLNLKTRLD